MTSAFLASLDAPKEAFVPSQTIPDKGVAKNRFFNDPPVKFKVQKDILGNPVVTYSGKKDSNTVTLRRFDELYEVIA